MLEGFFRLFEKKSLALPSEQLLQLFGSVPTLSGIVVSPEAALRVPAVSAAIRAIGEAIAQLPLILYRRTEDGGKERAIEHPAFELLHSMPNPWSSSYAFRLSVQSDALMNDVGGLAFVNRVGGNVRELIRLNPKDVAVEVAASGEPSYVVREGAGERRLHFEDVLHIRPFGEVGKAPLTLAREAIGLAIAAEASQALLHKNGAQTSGVYSIATPLDTEQHKQLTAWIEAHIAGNNKLKPLIVDRGATWTQTQMTGVDAQHLETRKFQIEEIARAFRVPPHLLFELGRSTWSNAEIMNKAFLTYTLLPWIREWQGALTRCVLTPAERKTHLIEVLVDDFARADLAARMTAYSTAIESGFLTPNEARAAENRPPLPGGDELRAASTAPAEAVKAA